MNSGKMFWLTSVRDFGRNRLQRLVVHELGAERVLVAGEEDARFLDGALRRAPLLVDGADLHRHADGLHRLRRRREMTSVTGGSSAPRCPLRPTRIDVVGVVLEDVLQLDRAVADLRARGCAA